MKTPVVLIIFNRPDLTRQVLEKIEDAKPERLFIISDGPRQAKVGEDLLVQKTRDIVKNVSWNCTVERKYSDSNLGCRKSVSSGLDWVFSRVDRAIILEDDCIPHPSFFPYCEELLERYKNDKNIAMISGNNFFGKNSNHSSYDFSYHSLIWGWATWRRAWNLYHQAEDKGAAYFDTNYIELNKRMKKNRLLSIKQTLLGKIDTWDYVWQYALLISKSLCIYPSNNLVQNIGFDVDATHTKYPTFHARLSTKKLSFPLVHPKRIEVNSSFEKQMEKTYNRFSILLDLLKQSFRL